MQSENYLLSGSHVSYKELKDDFVTWDSFSFVFVCWDNWNEFVCFIFHTALIYVSLRSLARWQSCYGTAMGEKTLVYISTKEWNKTADVFVICTWINSVFYKFILQCTLNLLVLKHKWLYLTLAALSSVNYLKHESFSYQSRWLNCGSCSKDL